MQTLSFTIAIQPITKKNSIDLHIIKDRTGKQRVIPSPSKRYKKYEDDCWPFIPQPEKPIDTPVNVEARFYMNTRRLVDLVNLQEALLDILVKYGVLKDDNSRVVVSMDGSRVLYDKDNPRTEVCISEVEVMNVWDE